MKKSQHSFIGKLFPILKKNEEKREPRNYTTLVESFKTKVQVN
ncbi:hypothetical protein [Polaribacter aestuariivivens]|nr:hypothetical protein [Polaribacter aestuariivivens]